MTGEDLGKVFGGAVAGYFLRAWQEGQRAKRGMPIPALEGGYEPVTTTNGLPQNIADKAEELLAAGGKILQRRAKDTVEILLRAGVGDEDTYEQYLAPIVQTQLQPHEPPHAGEAKFLGVIDVSEPGAPVHTGPEKMTGTGSYNNYGYRARTTPFRGRAI